MLINNNFVDKNGHKYDGVIEKALTKDELNHIGIFVNQTKRQENIFIKTNGVYIYQDRDNSNIGYRIYDEYADYGFNGYGDAKLISNFNKIRDNVKLTDLPIGVVSSDGNIVGQIIHYYPNCESVYQYAKRTKNINVIKYYKEMINILKELYDNGMIYVDTHAKNYLIVKNDIKLIDFDSSYIDFSDTKFKYDSMIYTFIRMLKILNELLGIDFDIKNDLVRDLQDIEEVVEEMEKKLVK